MKRLAGTALLICSVATTAVSAPIDVFFRGTLTFDDTNSRFLSNSLTAVDTAVRSILEDAYISGRFALDLNTPLRPGTSNAPGDLAEYVNASTDLEMTVAGSEFVDGDPSACRVTIDNPICDARQRNDSIFSSTLPPFDIVSIFSDLVPSEELTRAIEAESGVSATVVRPRFSFFVPVNGEIGLFANGFDLLSSTDLANPFDIPADEINMIFALSLPNSFLIAEGVDRPRYAFRFVDPEISRTPFPPTAAIPLPIPAFLLLTGFGAFFLLRGRREP